LYTYLTQNKYNNLSLNLIAINIRNTYINF
jgi:hypothetical protein